jgi:hypothetical protein
VGLSEASVNAPGAGGVQDVVRRMVPVGGRLHTVSGLRRIASDSGDTWRAWEGNTEGTGGKHRWRCLRPRSRCARGRDAKTPGADGAHGDFIELTGAL